MTSPAARRLMTELFAGQGWPAQGEELLQQSLGPRAPELLLEAPGWLGLDAGQLVLEAGCRDATHAIALAGRYGCRVLGVDLVAAWLPKGRADMVWCRDVLSCVGDGGRMLSECARVLRPGGGMVLYAVFATDQLPPADRALLVEGLGNSPASMHQPTLEAAIAAGFQVVRRERIARLWSEHQLERDPAYFTRTCSRSPPHPQPRPGRGHPRPRLVPTRPGVRQLAAPDRAGSAHADPLRTEETTTRQLTAPEFETSVVPSTMPPCRHI